MKQRTRRKKITQSANVRFKQAPGESSYQGLKDLFRAHGLLDKNGQETEKGRKARTE